MEITRMEIMVAVDTIANEGESQVHELNEIQLALVGGGSGDTIAY